MDDQKLAALQEMETAGIKTELAEETIAGVLETSYENFVDWVENYWAIMFTKPIGNEYRWCPKWWCHREVVEVLLALYEVWKISRQDPNLRIQFFVYYAWPAQTHLLEASGPMRDCSITYGHNQLQTMPRLTTEPSPADEFIFQPQPEEDEQESPQLPMDFLDTETIENYQPFDLPRPELIEQTLVSETTPQQHQKTVEDASSAPIEQGEQPMEKPESVPYEKVREATEKYDTYPDYTLDDVERYLKQVEQEQTEQTGQAE